MKKKLIFLSICISVLMIVTTLTSVVGIQNKKDAVDKKSPLFDLRANEALRRGDGFLSKIKKLENRLYLFPVFYRSEQENTPNARNNGKLPSIIFWGCTAMSLDRSCCWTSDCNLQIPGENTDVREVLPCKAGFYSISGMITFCK